MPYNGTWQHPLELTHYLFLVRLPPFPSASQLVSQAVSFARSLRSCKGVYLHVVEYNLPAIRLYERLRFVCLRSLPRFYLLEGGDYTALLYVFYLNGGGPPAEDEW